MYAIARPVGHWPSRLVQLLLGGRSRQDSLGQTAEPVKDQFGVGVTIVIHNGVVEVSVKPKNSGVTRDAARAG